MRVTSRLRLTRHPDRLSREEVIWRVVGAVLIGFGLAAGALWLYLTKCPPDDKVCEPLRTSPPWALLSALAAMPAILLTWVWRTAHKEQDLEIAQASLANERFVAAVGLLNSKEIDARLGGIYALEGIARDSPIDAGPVTELLAAFVRRHTAKPEQEEDDDFEEPYLALAPQTALTVLGRLPLAGREQTPIDLSDADLAGAKITGNFDGANFDGSWFTRVRFIDVNARSASFRHSFWARVTLTGKCSFNGSQWEHVKCEDGSCPQALETVEWLAQSAERERRSRPLLTRALNACLSPFQRRRP
jgi:hypothetical protein